MVIARELPVMDRFDAAAMSGGRRQSLAPAAYSSSWMRVHSRLSDEWRRSIDEPEWF